MLTGVEDGQTVRMPVGKREIFVTFRVGALLAQPPGEGPAEASQGRGGASWARPAIRFQGEQSNVLPASFCGRSGEHRAASRCL